MRIAHTSTIYIINIIKFCGCSVEGQCIPVASASKRKRCVRTHLQLANYGAEIGLLTSRPRILIYIDVEKRKIGSA